MPCCEDDCWNSVNGCNRQWDDFFLRYLKPIVESRYLLNMITPPLKVIQVTTYAAGCSAALGGSGFSVATLTVGRMVLGSE